MPGILPSRYTPEVNDRIIQEAGRILAQAAASGKPRSTPRAAAAAVLLPVVVLGGVVLHDLGKGGDPGRVAFDRSSVISADATGTGARASDFAPRQPKQAMPLPTGAPAAPPAAAPMPVRRARSAPNTPRGEIDIATKRQDVALAEEVLFDEADPAAFALVVNAPTEAPPPRLLSVGTRIPVVFQEPLITGSTPVPATARVAVPVEVEGRVTLPGGTTVIGEAFAVAESDRVQVAFTTVLLEGRSVPLQGLALAGDGGLGVPGKVLKKGKGRGAAGRLLGVLGSAANAASLGLLGGERGLHETAAVELAQGLTHDMQSWANRFSFSDKVVRVPAGTNALVYLRADLTLP